MRGSNRIMEKKKLKLVVTPTRIRLITSLKDGLCITEFFKKTEITYAAVHRVLRDWEKIGLIYFEKEGRKRNVYFTVKGLRVQGVCRKLYGEIIRL